MVFGTVLHDQIRRHGHRTIDLPIGAAIDPSALPGASTVTVIKAAAAGVTTFLFVANRQPPRPRLSAQT
jgi:hypothetical protein